MPEFFDLESVNIVLTRGELIENCVLALLLGILSGTVSLVSGLPKR